MQKRTVTVITVCDLCEAPLAEAEIGTSMTISGIEYIVDLCAEHGDALSTALTPFTTVAREIGRVRLTGPMRPARRRGPKATTPAKPTPAKPKARRPSAKVA